MNSSFNICKNKLRLCQKIPQEDWCISEDVLSLIKINFGTFCITDLTLNLSFFIFNEKNFRKSFMVYFPRKCLFFVYLTDILIMYQIVICCPENYLKVEWATLKNLDFNKTYNVIFKSGEIYCCDDRSCLERYLSGR